MSADHEQAAFGGASSVKRLAADDPARITPVEDDDDFDNLFLSLPERLLIVAIWCAAMTVVILAVREVWRAFA